MARGAPAQGMRPNRSTDGEHAFDGTVHRLPLTQPAAWNAIHGRTRWSPRHPR